MTSPNIVLIILSRCIQIQPRSKGMWQILSIGYLVDIFHWPVARSSYLSLSNNKQATLITDARQCVENSKPLLFLLLTVQAWTWTLTSICSHSFVVFLHRSPKYQFCCIIYCGPLVKQATSWDRHTKRSYLEIITKYWWSSQNSQATLSLQHKLEK